MRKVRRMETEAMAVGKGENGVDNYFVIIFNW